MNNFNPWHDLPLETDREDVFEAIIEIPRGSRAKYELDKNSGMLRLDRVIYSSMYYPANYGFFPKTYGDDKDPLDVLILSQVDVHPMCIMRAKIIGVMRMIDHGEIDDKIIAVCPDDVSVDRFDDIADLPEYKLKEMQAFFDDYKKLEDKTVSVEGFKGKKEALEILTQAKKDYEAKFLAS